MGFNANSVPRLDWDFTAWLDEQPAARGITPEPSQKMIEKFVGDFQSLSEEIGGSADTLGDNRAVAQAIGAKFGGLSAEEQEAKAEELYSELIAIIADLTQGSPSRLQLQQLQADAPRVFKAYMGWLWGSLNPEA